MTDGVDEFRENRLKPAFSFDTQHLPTKFHQFLS